MPKQFMGKYLLDYKTFFFMLISLPKAYHLVLLREI